MKIFKKYRIIILLLILVLAGFLRLWQIDSIPPGLYPDEAINGNDALETLSSNQFKVFYPENNGREGLFIWLIAFVFKILGPTAWSLRLVSAIFGILTVLGLYLLSKELFSLTNLSKKYPPLMIAIFSSFFLAISFWHINFSRISFRAILVPFLMCFSFYFLLRALRKNSTLDYIWSGIFFGLGFYTYIAFRVAVLILGIVVLLKIINDFKWLWRKSYLLFLTILIVALPIGLHFFNTPQDFIGRAGGVSVFNAEEPIKALGLSTIKTLAMFNFVGDWNWRHNLAGSPMLAWPVGILFIIGFIIITKNMFSQMRRPIFENLPNIFLFTWFFVMLLPAILTSEGIPHALRTIGLIPVVYILAAIGLIWIINKLTQLDQKLVWLALIVFLIYPALSNFNKYFSQWAKNPNVSSAFRNDLVILTNYLNELPENVKKYVIVNEPGVLVPYPNGIPMPAQTIIFMSKSDIKYLVRDSKHQTTLKQPFVIVPLRQEQGMMQQFSEIWPNVKINKINNFFVYEIK